MLKLTLATFILVCAFSACKVQNNNDIRENPAISEAGQLVESTTKSPVKAIKENTSKLWKKFETKEGRFKVEFPGEPQTSSDEIDWFDNKLTEKRFEVDYKNLLFRISYIDYPDAGQLNKEELKKTYDHYRDELLRCLGGKVITDRDVKLNGHSGREVRISDGRQIDNYHFYKIGNRTYQINMTFKAAPSKHSNLQKVAAYFYCTFEFID